MSAFRKPSYFKTYFTSSFGMAIAVEIGVRACLRWSSMRKQFCKLVVGVILTASLSTVAVAQASSDSDDKNEKKETVRIVVVDKKDDGKSAGGGESKKPRPTNYNQIARAM
jgi:hypothetical protein